MRVLGKIAGTLVLGAGMLLAGCGGGGGATDAAAASPLRSDRQAIVSGVTTEEAARQAMDYAENILPGLFPGHEPTLTWGPLHFRFYQATGIYLGVVVKSGTEYTLNGVYVMGGSFGMAPRYVGQVQSFISPTTPSNYILDSFGQIVAGGGDGVGNGDAGADGTAGDGSPIVGAKVVVTDANGRTVSAVTDTLGHYRVKVTGFTPPFVARVTRADGRVYTSLNVVPTKTNAYVTMNISGLTDKVSSDVARAGGKTKAVELTPQIVASNTTAITQSVNELRTSLSTVISASGIAPASFDPIGTPFRPNHQGIDYVLDNTVINYSADGSTQVAVSPTFVAPAQGYPGTWSFTETVEGQVIPVGNVPGSAVPTPAAIAAMTNSTIGQQYASSYQGYTVTFNGNTVRVTGANTDYTITINSFNVSNYQGCGSCGVGTTVSYDMFISATSRGTFEGSVDPGTTISTTATLLYRRVS